MDLSLCGFWTDGNVLFNRKNPSGHRIKRDFIPRDLMELSLLFTYTKTWQHGVLSSSLHYSHTISVYSEWHFPALNPQPLICCFRLPKSRLEEIQLKLRIDIVQTHAIFWLFGLKEVSFIAFSSYEHIIELTSSCQQVIYVIHIRGSCWPRNHFQIWNSVF